MRPHDPGLVVHHDIRNERWLLKDKLPRAVGASATGPAPFTPRTVHHRQYGYVYQGMTPRCTGFGSVTYLLAAHPFNRSPITGDDWYERNVAFDRAAGRFYDGGATVIAALMVGKELGFYESFWWAYTMRTMQEAIAHAPLIAGTLWYPSMFERDAEGIVKLPGPNDSADAGHLYTINAYDAKRGLWRVPNTWNDGDYFIPDELMYRLVREEGEIAQPSEIKIPMTKRAA